MPHRTAVASDVVLQKSPLNRPRAPKVATSVINSGPASLSPILQRQIGRLGVDGVRGLQRQAGNRAVSELLGLVPTSPHLRAADRGAVPTIQRRRSERPKGNQALFKLDGQSNFGSGKPFGSEERASAVWIGLEGVYEASLRKGTQLWEQLNDAREDYGLSPNTVTSTLQAKRAIYEERFREHYATRVSGLGGGVYETSTSGFVEKDPDAQPKSNVYNNKMDLTTGTMHAVHDYATKDKARKHDAKHKGQPGYEEIGLPNSEVMWQQYLAVARSQFWYDKENRARALMGKLSRFVVNQAVNPTTQQVVFMAYPNGSTTWFDPMTWDPSQDEFKAILGTPNVAPAVFMMLDHVDEIGARTILEILTHGGPDQLINVEFGPSQIKEEQDLALLAFKVFLVLGMGVLAGYALG